MKYTASFFLYVLCVYLTVKGHETTWCGKIKSPRVVIYVDRSPTQVRLSANLVYHHIGVSAQN